jgi:acyl-CoA reductase-like NAD-dependent aldehyde dehydrogenase
MAEYSLLINGESVSTEESTTVTDPCTNDPVTTVALAGTENVQQAIESSARAFESWQTVDPVTRGQHLSAIADELRSSIDKIAQRHTEETGRSISDSKRSVQFAAEYFDYYAGLTNQIMGKTIPLPTQDFDFTKREPLGVTGHIIPWNSPLLLASRSIAPALACGNTVVAKPAQLAPMAVLEIGHAAHEAGLPPGVLNVVPGRGSVAGEAITTDERIAEITFTGSKTVGLHIRETVADRLIPLNLELGGKSPNIVFADADLAAAADGAVKLFSNAGQSCYAGTRLFVEDTIYEEFVDRVLENIHSLELSTNPNTTDVSPLISPDAQSDVDSYVESALDTGASVLIGGGVPFEQGNFYEPTLIEGAPDDAAVSCEEVFGPLLTVYEFSSEQEVIDRANDTEYGLYSGVWTGKLDRAHRMTDNLEAGTVTVNNYSSPIPQVPFPGYKQSGIGTEYADAAVSHYTKVKNVRMRIDRELR